jgi:hypothetical protein
LQPNLELAPPNPGIEPNLNLPLEIKHRVISLQTNELKSKILSKELGELTKDKVLYSYTPEDFRVILKIFSSYQKLSIIYFQMQKNITLLEKDVDILTGAFNKCNETLYKVEEDREFIYNLREKEVDSLKKEIKKNDRRTKIKTILVSTGSGLVGIGAGILIGALIAN